MGEELIELELIRLYEVYKKESSAIVFALLKRNALYQ